MATERIYVSTSGNEDTARETQPVEMDATAVAALEWKEGIDNTPWKQKCLIAHEGDTVYYRYPEK